MSRSVRWTAVPTRPSAPLGHDYIPDAFVTSDPEAGVDATAGEPEIPPTPPVTLDSNRLRAAVVGNSPVPSARVYSGVCLASSAAFEDAVVLESGRIHRVLHLRGQAGVSMTAVLHADVAPADLMLEEHLARWRISLVDERYAVVATTDFTTEVPIERMWGVLETSLTLDGASLAIEVRFGWDCDGHKYDQTFDIAVTFGTTPACVEVDEIKHKGFI